MSKPSYLSGLKKRVSLQKFEAEGGKLKNIYLSVGSWFNDKDNNPHQPKALVDSITIQGNEYTQGVAGTGGIVYSLKNPEKVDLAKVFDDLRPGTGKVGSRFIIVSMILMDEDYKVVRSKTVDQVKFIDSAD